MPRPSAAQILYGSVTVVFSTLAMLLLSGARTRSNVVIVTVAGLALGLLVAVAIGGARRGPDRAGRETPAAPGDVPADAASGPGRERAGAPSGC